MSTVTSATIIPGSCAAIVVVGDVVGLWNLKDDTDEPMHALHSVSARKLGNGPKEVSLGPRNKDGSFYFVCCGGRRKCDVTIALIEPCKRSQF